MTTIALSVSRILEETYALEALTVTDWQTRPAMLTRANEPALRRVLRGCFGHLLLSLGSCVADSNIGETDDTADILTVVTANTVYDPMQAVLVAERSLSRSLLALTHEGDDLCAVHEAMAAMHARSLLTLLGGSLTLRGYR